MAKDNSIFDFTTGQSVRGAMLEAGAQGKGVYGRSVAGARAALKQKLSSAYSGRGESTKVSKVLRLMGGDNEVAEWIDRFFLKPSKTKKSGSTAPDRVTQVSAGIAENTAALININRRVTAIHGLVGVIAADVADIKSIIAPKGVVAAGRSGTAASGQVKFIQFNPMAPQGEQFREITESGKLTNRKPGKDYQDSASQQAALETARLAIKITEKEKERAELRRKWEYKDEAEDYTNQSPLAALRSDMNDKFNEINKKLDDKSKKGPFGLLFGMLTGLGMWLWNKIKNPLEILKSLSGLATKLAGITTSLATMSARLLSLMGLPALISGLPLAFMALVTKWAAEADMNNPGWNPFALVAVKAKEFADRYNERTGNTKKWKDQEEKNKAAGRTRGGVASTSGMSMEDAIKNLDARANDQKLTEEQRKANATARDNLIRASGKATTTPQQETIPAEIVAVGSDTVDTNYADTPVASPTATLMKAPAAPNALISKIGFSGSEWEAYRNTIASIESGGDYSAKGGSGNHYDGRYQLGKAAKQDAAQMLGIPFPGHDAKAREAFRSNPELQEQMFAAYTAANHKYLMAGSKKYRELSLRQKMETLGYAHNQGWAGAKEWLETGKVGADAFGTKGTKYSTALAKNLQGISPTMVASMTPSPTISGGMIDGTNRSNAILASTAASSGSVPVIAPVVNNSLVQQSTPRKAAKASTVTNDSTLLGAAQRDRVHPVFAG